ncbi:MAG TPA: transposase [Pirellulales bacterium]|nr:transposase [Pirellulales bacterium]
MLASLLQNPGLPFADSRSEEAIEAAFSEEGISFGQEDDEVYSPALTLWAFLSQMLFKDEQRSCVAAVSRIIVLLVSLGRKPCSDNTGAYCRARAKLSEGVLHRLTYQVADGCEAAIPHRWRWTGLRVFLVDGFTVSMPDTPENQEAYPQPTSQQEGLGFPLLRGLVSLSLATAMVHGFATGPYSGKETGETALLRELLDRFHPGDVIVADRYHCSYFMICLLKQRGVEVVVRLHQRRKADFRRGKRLGTGDHLVQWLRPSRPDWMDEETYQQMPGVDRDTRGRSSRLSARFPRTGARRRHHLARRETVYTPRHRRTLSSKVVGGARYSRHEVQHGNGRVALQIARDGSQGDLGLSLGLQPDSTNPAAVRVGAETFATTDQLHRGDAEGRGQLGSRTARGP